MDIHAEISNSPITPPEIMVICGIVGVFCTQIFMGVTYPNVDMLTMLRHPFVMQPAVLAIPFDVVLAIDFIFMLSCALIAYPVVSYIFQRGI